MERPAGAIHRSGHGWHGAHPPPAHGRLWARSVMKDGWVVRYCAGAMTTGTGGVADEVQVAEPPPAERIGPPTTGPAGTRLTGRLRQVWTLGCVAFVAQGAGLLLWSRHLWSRFDLTSDFGTFSQAWQQIGTGHLNPRETTFAYNYPHYGYPFWQSHFETPDVAAGPVPCPGSSTFGLLIVQDLALAGTAWPGSASVSSFWSVSGRPDQGRTLIGLGLLFALWSPRGPTGRRPSTSTSSPSRRSSWCCAPRRVERAAPGLVVGRGVLLCGDVAASYLLGLGIAAVLSGRATRRMDGCCRRWESRGSSGDRHRLGQGLEPCGNYGYLAHVNSSSGLGATFGRRVGIPGHPSGVISVLHSRWTSSTSSWRAPEPSGPFRPWASAWESWSSFPMR